MTSFQIDILSSQKKIRKISTVEYGQKEIGNPGYCSFLNYPNTHICIRYGNMVSIIPFVRVCSQ